MRRLENQCRRRGCRCLLVGEVNGVNARVKKAMLLMLKEVVKKKDRKVVMMVMMVMMCWVECLD